MAANDTNQNTNPANDTKVAGTDTPKTDITGAPKTEAKAEAKATGQPMSNGQIAGGFAIFFLIAVLAGFAGYGLANKDQQFAAQLPPANVPAGKVQAIEVEVIPLNATKTNTHAHVLHGQACAGNEGKKVKVRVDHPTVPGLKGWDWYTCPPKKV